MPTLYIANQDGPGVYRWDFKQVPWFEFALASWMLRRSPNGLTIWAGFLKGVMEVMEQQKKLEAWDYGPVIYEPSDPED